MLADSEGGPAELGFENVEIKIMSNHVEETVLFLVKTSLS